MKRSMMLLLMAMFCFIYKSYAQSGENNIWTFGHGYSLDFNYNPPLLKDTVYYNGQSNRTSNPNNVFFNYHRASTVCDGSGNLLFTVKCLDAVSNPNAPNIFDRNENPIAGTNFLFDPLDGAYNKIPSIVPHAGNPNQYYIFYTRNKGLLYSLFDISLNGGLGNVVPGQHNRLLGNYNTVIGSRMTTVQGCNGIWLIVRHQINNQYLSYKIDENGLQITPVVSDVGLMPINAYSTQVELVASPNGQSLATAFPKVDHLNQQGGIELYDFDKCNGKLKNARIFDEGNFNYGIAFSPDNSKLYVQCNLPRIQPNQPLSQTEHNLYQFDLSLLDLTAIENSKTLILSNPAVQWNITFCPQNIGALGSMRIGRNGKLYMTNGQPQVCTGTSGVGLALHVINQPDLPGLSCSPNLNAIYNFQNGMFETYGRTNLPREIVLPPKNRIDTITSPLMRKNVCNHESDTLKVVDGASCIEWSNGSPDNEITVTQSGIYWVKYFKGCDLYIDSFDVHFATMPNIEAVQYGCPGYIELKAGAINGAPFGLSLYNSFGGKIYEKDNGIYHSVPNLDAGIYTLNISSRGDCFTTMEVELKAYPIPVITVIPPIAQLLIGEEIKLSAYGAMNYTWTPAGSLNTRTSNEVIARPTETTDYTVVGTNDYGCRDTAYVKVSVDYNKNIRMPNAFTPNGDGINDLFSLPGGNWNILRFEVYNRFGQMVYQYSDNKAGWDGRYNAKNCDAGIYYYNVSLEFPDGTNRILKGDISLIR